MKIVKDVILSLVVGILAGLIVATLSYYNDHKDGGILQTALAVVKSYDTVAAAYGKEKTDTGSLIFGTKNEDLVKTFDNLDLDQAEVSNSLNEIADVLGVDEFEEDDDSKNAFDKENHVADDFDDVLAMDGTDGGVNDGMPYDGILRFHVRANSDLEQDQALKMAVKDDVVSMLKPMLCNCKNVKESKQIIVSNLEQIYETAVGTIVEEGYDYDVKVYVTEEEFPAKTYGDLTFPKGQYQALRIDIGEAKGHNWWCVMYPPLCFVDESTGVVSQKGKEQLKEALTKEEYQQLFSNPEVEIKPSFRFLKLFDSSNQ